MIHFIKSGKIIDLSSSIISIAAGIAIIVAPVDLPDTIKQIHYPVFWGIVAIVFGLIQFISTMMRRQEMTRTVMAWLIGAGACWVAVLMLKEQGIQYYHYIPWILGFCNVAAFSINILSLLGAEEHYHSRL